MERNNKKLMSGNEAIAWGAHDYGVQVASAYPGTPSTEILENIANFDDVYAEWAPNEKVALEVAIGASLGGVRALASMKHVGLNVAADPFFTASYIGVNGGLVIISADDPGMHSSQNEQDNRHYALAAKVPMLEPADSQEAYEFIGEALEISEQFDTPVLLRVTTRVSHSKGVVERKAKRVKNLKEAGFVKNPTKYVMVPNFARQRHDFVEQRMDRLREFSEETPLNRIEWGRREVGMVTSNVAYQYAREARPRASFLKLGLSHPLPENLIREFADGVKKLFVVEELDPYLEDQIKALGIPVLGKERFPICGELSPDLVKQGLSRKRSKKAAAGPPSIPPRPPALCPGCPHSASFYTMKKLKLNVMGDIGCYTLSVAPPLETMDSTLCMGASIGMAHGMDKALGADPESRSVAVLGDSTFLHSGVTALMNIAYNRGNSTTVVLDNRTTAMTGFQEHAATGRTLKGVETPEVDFEALGKALGIDSVRTVDPYELKGLEKALKEEVEAPHSSLIIARRECLLLKRERKTPKTVDPEKCVACNMCLLTGCPALSRTSDNKAQIDSVICNGCPICQQICKLDAISDLSQD
jgi:indolepyruvate ferredoxin oxidoreductase alpha subunit